MQKNAYEEEEEGRREREREREVKGIEFLSLQNKTKSFKLN
jgi:hypothetical protein